MSWGVYEPLADVIAKAQAATILMQGSQGTGSAVMISDRFAITAAHVVMNLGSGVVGTHLIATNIWNETQTVKNVIGYVGNDFAIVEFDHAFAHAYAAKVASAEAAAGTQTFTVGFPYDVAEAHVGWAVSFGTANGVPYDTRGNTFDIDTLPGNSGGGVFNAQGEVVGLVSAATAWDALTNQYATSPYYSPTSSVYNQMMDFVGGRTMIAVPEAIIQTDLAANGVKNQPGGDASLPANLPDPARQSFVPPAELVQITGVAQSSRLSTVAIGVDGTDLVHIGLLATGVLISPDLVLTNLHVVIETQGPMVVGFAGGELYTGCSTIMVSPTTDMAIIRLSKSAPSQYSAVHLAASAIDFGEAAYTVGQPADLWYTSGGWLVSAEMGQFASRGDLFLFGSTGQGNSGGGIFDATGGLAGLLWGGGATTSTAAWDRQDPHETAYNPAAQTPQARILGVGYAELQEFVSSFASTGGGVTAGSDARVQVGYAYANAFQADGKILSAGRLFNGTDNDIAVIRSNADGTRDATFGSNGKATLDLGGADAAADVATSANGRILVAGTTYTSAGSDFVVSQLNANGALDTAFGIQGVATIDFGGHFDFAKGMVVQADGRIVVAGSSFDGTTSDFAVTRLLSNGQLDTGFGVSGRATTDFGHSSDFGTSVAIQADGKIVVAGYTDVGGSKMDFALIRYTQDGVLDPTFGTNGKVTTDWGDEELASSVVIQPDGRIVVLGYAWSWGTPDCALARYNSDGSLDASFSGDGKLVQSTLGGNDYGQSVVLQADGKIVVAGRAYVDPGQDSNKATGNDDVNVYRFNPDGSLDTSFSGDGMATLDRGGDDFGQSALIQPDGKVVVSGYSVVDETPYFSTSRLNSDGSADTAFNLATTIPAGEIKGWYSYDSLVGGAGSDRLRGAAGDDSLDGGAGIDTALFAGSRAEYAISRSGALVTVSDTIVLRDGTDVLTSVERVQFSDMTIAVDIDGVGGKAFRLYQAAYDRAPDKGGLGWWMHYLDQGFDFTAAANNFLNSSEFVAMYGPNPTNEAFVRLLYQHVHHREPDAGGNQFWIDAMANKDGVFGHAFTKGEILLAFSESAENKANLIGVMQNGFEYTPFSG